ncbi:MAG: cupin domain-containing protein [Vulcanimicrobiaceae bacterium]
MQRQVVRRAERGWEGVEREGYVPGVASAVVRHTLVGRRKAAPDEPGPTMEARYFELPPGTVTRLEKHEHEHVVIVGEGRGLAIVGSAVREIGPHDVVYTAPWEPHQFVNRSDATFGIFCIVPAYRDISQRLSEDELACLRASPAGAYADPDGAPPPRPALAASERSAS